MKILGSLTSNIFSNVHIHICLGFLIEWYKQVIEPLERELRDIIADL